MKKWTVELPLAGSVIVNDVEAENEQAAIDAAFQLADFKCVATDPNRVEVGEMDVYRRITQGNVLHAPVNEASATEVEDTE